MKADTYKAAVLTVQGIPPALEVQILPKPRPGPNEVLVRLNLTSLCGTDCTQAAGHLGPTRAVLGHEGVGRIEALGSNVGSLDPSITPGQRVGVAWTRDFCGRCAFCTNLARDGETRCAAKPHSGQHCDGTFAQYTLVPARYLLRIPDSFAGVPDEHLAPVLCGGVTAYKALKSCDGLYPGQWVAVSGGGGGVGAFVVAFGKAMGYRMIAVDAGKEKARFALGEGAEHFVDITSAEVKSVGAAAEVKRLTGGLGAPAVLVCAGVGAAYQTAIEMLAPFGTLVCVGIPPPGQVFSMHPLQFIASGFKVIGTSVGTRRDTLEALEFVRRGLVTPKVQWAELEKMTELMDDVVKGKVQGKYVISLDNV
ncbi:hypothetical protein M406DRAFT_72672 [Cryphonectria parasitica EP155]|uniref:Enoyl reductase (ER) domain-containing protein n=1 Tax=Cryphonectria parasitica (strain ATCC 38755 / EP155) TaxID=660469 RepID=A0A9P4XXF7_CRYP1|nr:uncharacterized protein M406DRAFT_72672 [Cryphonectria parasitica EP155]KAF3762691.1 hypothetical protein M406DRAFT_72672 [Cryphonectria parasitica EP155]